MGIETADQSVSAEFYRRPSARKDHGCERKVDHKYEKRRLGSAVVPAV